MKPKKRDNILLVKNLPCHSHTPSELNEYFAPYGTLQELYWPTTTDGAFRDYAFVKYETADQAAHAFLDVFPRGTSV
jgi:RNA recognition motif-containing protein